MQRWSERCIVGRCQSVGTVSPSSSAGGIAIPLAVLTGIVYFV